MLQKISEFVRGLCCDHAWDRKGHKGNDRCTACGATCTRDEEGRIVLYSSSGRIGDGT